MSIYIIDPLSDSRWDDLVARHPKASAFHKRGWLKALRLTYGYEPFVLTRSAPGQALKDGLVLCRVSSWITGTRAVSLPFADHCEPLVDGGFSELSTWLHAELARRRWKYIELRPLSSFVAVDTGMQQGQSYWFHELDIRPSLPQIFHNMHRDSIQRKIRRGEREGLSYQVGRSAELLEAFYQLLLITRRRLRILPQPLRWFRNLVETMGDGLQIWVARHDSRSIASIMTLRHRQSVIYKYGCSNDKFHNLGGMPFLFWKLIEESKAEGAETIDFGRSDLENKGLIAFKDRLGTRRRELSYWRIGGGKSSITTRWESETLRRFVAILPDAVCSAAGRILYRHAG